MGNETSFWLEYTLVDMELVSFGVKWLKQTATLFFFSIRI